METLSDNGRLVATLMVATLLGFTKAQEIADLSRASTKFSSGPAGWSLDAGCQWAWATGIGMQASSSKGPCKASFSSKMFRQGANQDPGELCQASFDYNFIQQDCPAVPLIFVNQADGHQVLVAPSWHGLTSTGICRVTVNLGTSSSRFMAIQLTIGLNLSLSIFRLHAVTIDGCQPYIICPSVHQTRFVRPSNATAIVVEHEAPVVPDDFACSATPSGLLFPIGTVTPIIWRCISNLGYPDVRCRTDMNVTALLCGDGYEFDAQLGCKLFWPGPLLYFSAVALNWTTVELTWTEPSFRANQIAGYRISYHAEDSNNTREITVPTLLFDGSVTVNKLEPSIECYSFQVTAFDNTDRLLTTTTVETTVLMPRDCVYEWSPWTGNCKVCSRHPRIILPARGQGAPCPAIEIGSCPPSEQCFQLQRCEARDAVFENDLCTCKYGQICQSTDPIHMCKSKSTFETVCGQCRCISPSASNQPTSGSHNSPQQAIVLICSILGALLTILLGLYGGFKYMLVRRRRDRYNFSFQRQLQRKGPTFHPTEMIKLVLTDGDDCLEQDLVKWSPSQQEKAVAPPQQLITVGTLLYAEDE